MVDRKGWRVFNARGMHKRGMIRGLLVAALVLLLLVSGCGGGGGGKEEQGKQMAGQEEKGTQTAGQAEESKPTAVAGQVKIIYEDDAIKPENRDVVEQLRKSGVLERSAEWSNERLALPYGIEVRVTDDVPEGVTDQSNEADGRTIWIPGSWLTDTHELNTKIVKEVNRPAVFPKEKFNADDLNVLTNQYIFGHEMGHALTRHLMLPLTGFEEDAADGFASFYNVNEEGSDPVIAAAMLFDEIARQQGDLTTEHFASDHPITQQRVYNFLCLLEGSDPEKWQGPLVDEGYLPESRAPLCPMEWAQLNHGWWTVLEPHFTEAFREQGTEAQEQAREQLIAENEAFAEVLKKIRTGQ
jgi:Putative metallopeptidase